MKIVAMGDIHERVKAFEIISSEISAADLVIITGDLTQFGNEEKARKVIDVIREINPNIVAQVGNLDSLEIDRFLTREGINIHGSGRVIDDVGIFGSGGSGATPFHTPVEFSEEELKGFLEKGYSEIKDAAIKIMICHAPPINTEVDMIPSGTHVGSKAVREFIERYQPDLCITGHIHEASGEDAIGRTKIINPGPFFEGGFVVINVEKGKLEAELRYFT
ncbi:MAG: metallophosphoesterase [Deltaproteobacteria bacterium]|nr:metallophosphoesterase [Deltaproteobacteria bacterium]